MTFLRELSQLSIRHANNAGSYDFFQYDIDFIL